VTGVFLLAESHASYHTYPEFGFLAVDFFTCGSCDPLAVAAHVLDALAPARRTTRLLDRSAPQPQLGCVPLAHNATPLFQEAI
jgi:S-adenosylmethionine decarboxylase